MPIEPRIPHDDLVVRHDVWSEGVDAPPIPARVFNLPHYRCTLSEPDGFPCAPPIVFHKGSPEERWHGWTTAKVIEALIKHMEYFESTDFKCDENKEILEHLRAAHKATEKRRDEREDRGVLYDHKTP